MSFVMKISKSENVSRDVMPSGLYKVRFNKFKPKYSKVKLGQEGQPTSLNYNAEMEILDHPEYAGRKVFEGLNEKASWIIEDFCHAFGIPVETDGTDIWLPGIWDGIQGQAETYTYKGPLTGQVGEIELGTDSYNGKPNNKVRRYFCKIPDCAQKFPTISHSQDLLKK